jgi:hypothetical protein
MIGGVHVERIWKDLAAQFNHVEVRAQARALAFADNNMMTLARVDQGDPDPMPDMLLTPDMLRNHFYKGSRGRQPCGTFPLLVTHRLAQEANAHYEQELAALTPGDRAQNATVRALRTDVLRYNNEFNKQKAAMMQSGNVVAVVYENSAPSMSDRHQPLRLLSHYYQPSHG